ncbi:uncharacterized protein LOC102390977 isoform X3 [Bubalus bubalis]|uniref:uncharacterized protein LOC102390977 isoform X3 n=1 Tax=Bubalus bubalis TaxID=89462 RepID=UPI001E1B6F67|nr:uncharacterized protein LOC102390977 isoform X3 [Bubalus bubalis]
MPPSPPPRPALAAPREPPPASASRRPLLSEALAQLTTHQRVKRNRSETSSLSCRLRAQQGLLKDNEAPGTIPGVRQGRPMEFKIGDGAREAPDSQAGRQAVNAGAERKLIAGRDPSVGSRGDGRSELSGEQDCCECGSLPFGLTEAVPFLTWEQDFTKDWGRAAAKTVF